MVMDSLPVGNSDFFFVPRSCHVGQFNFHTSLPSLKSTIFIHLSQYNIICSQINTHSNLFLLVFFYLVKKKTNKQIGKKIEVVVVVVLKFWSFFESVGILFYILLCTVHDVSLPTLKDVNFKRSGIKHPAE